MNLIGYFRNFSIFQRTTPIEPKTLFLGRSKIGDTPIVRIHTQQDQISLYPMLSTKDTFLSPGHSERKLIPKVHKTIIQENDRSLFTAYAEKNESLFDYTLPWAQIVLKASLAYFKDKPDEFKEEVLNLYKKKATLPHIPDISINRSNSTPITKLDFMHDVFKLLITYNIHSKTYKNMDLFPLNALLSRSWDNYFNKDNSCAGHIVNYSLAENRQAFYLLHTDYKKSLASGFDMLKEKIDPSLDDPTVYIPFLHQKTACQAHLMHNVVSEIAKENRSSTNSTVSLCQVEEDTLSSNSYRQDSNQYSHWTELLSTIETKIKEHLPSQMHIQADRLRTEFNFWVDLIPIRVKISDSETDSVCPAINLETVANTNQQNERKMPRQASVKRVTFSPGTK